MKSHLVNTRKRWGAKAQKMMIGQKMVMACYNTCIEIEEIKKGDIVFLYQNKVGIIALGRASGNRKVIDFDGDVDAAMTQKLTGFIRLRTPIQASTITAILRNFAKFEKGVFCRTRIEIPKKAADVLNAIAKVA